MILTILLTAVVLLNNRVQTFGEFTALCFFQLIIWLIIKSIAKVG